MNVSARSGLSAVLAMTCMVSSVAMADDYYAEPQVYGMRPNPGGEMALGQIGVTGLEARIYKGMRVTVESTAPNTPAHGKFKRGEIILGINGTLLKGKNPLVILGKALTQAEATDGVLTFDVKPLKGDTTKNVTLKIPILGRYAKTFPLNCEKSQKIIKTTADFYAGRDRLKEHDLWNAMACLFLLSTGDDAYVPRVKQYFAQYLEPDGTVTGLGEHSWFNGYNGVACAEYYLRTGDKSVLPILQYYCDDARKRQKYGVGWGHWGYSVFPSYESGGGMQHAAGNQILATLVLGKVCGVKVDEKTLQGALKHWYRFVGHGAIPIADQRYWHIMRSAGRDGATAAVMQIASGAKSDVTIYKKAKEYLVMSALTSWPARHYDWETYWHSLSGAMMKDYDPDLYRRTMTRFQWRYDLGRQASGAFAWPHNAGTKGDGKAGICLALAYTAPLKNLQINGAPRSKYAHDFTLPEQLWGNKADQAFLTSKHHKNFYKYGDEDEMDVLQRSLPLELRYDPSMAKKVDHEMLLKNVRHARCSIRMAAAKCLVMNKRFDVIEDLLRDPDPRLRRAALDGIIDCRPWFTGPVVGKLALKADQYTPAMVSSITKMLNDTEEAWFVIDAALQALNQAPIETIEKNLPHIIRWSTVDDWWMRESAFVALMGFERDETLFVKHLPTIIDIMIKEYNYNPRHKMVKTLQEVLATCSDDSPVRELIVDGFSRAALHSTVLPDMGKYKQSIEGTCNIVEVALASIDLAPEFSADMAATLSGDGRLKRLDTGNLMKVVHGNVHGHPVGLLVALQELSGKEKDRLTDILYNVYRPELISRYTSADKADNRLLNIILELTQLKNEGSGWKSIGTPAHANRIWRYRSFDPVNKEDRLHPREGKRMRTITLPADMEGWHKPGFDDSTWESGKAPVGTGIYKPFGHGAAGHDPTFFYPNNSDWGKGEFIAMRTTFTLTEEDLKKDFYRIRILTPMGFTLYLNGIAIHNYVWWYGAPAYNELLLDPSKIKHFKKGANTLSVISVVRYKHDIKAETYTPFGQMDVYFDALKKSDLGL
ncbi:MAG: hypothetical protein HN919_01560 [Verrucomicrobia bacterium]|jgi:hypothetical protein|nr:hypothetical protein [Verrucomicrobiota bacterium]MBT7064964.1 hypothetical protein [Verrucomicrobiota bacterium]MBT7699936.1 hypothetical protein [Verrucomicrobiota bacterium]